ncbi:Metal resistance protein YCF1 [Hortaea werneckii]|nr:Metal resistance protein YCF1 [Hortaea werneckii]
MQTALLRSYREVENLKTFRLDELCRGVKFLDLALFEDDDPITVKDGVDTRACVRLADLLFWGLLEDLPVSDRNNSTILEHVAAKRGLQHRVSLHIDRCGCLIKHQDIGAAFVQLRIQLSIHGCYMVTESGVIKNAPEFRSCILRNNSKSSPQVQEAHGTCTEVIDELFPAPVLPTTPIFSWDLISRFTFFSTRSRPSRPAVRWSLLADNLRGLARQACVLKYTLNTDDIRLDFDSLSHDPIEGLCDLQSIAHGQANKTRRETASGCDRDDGKSGGREDNDRA